MIDKRIRDAFSRIKQEMNELKQEISFVKQEISHLSSLIESILSAEVPRNVPNFRQRFIKQDFGTSEQQETIKTQNMTEISPTKQVSIGNRGVSALRQQIGNDSAHLGKEEVEELKRPDTSKQLQENVERLKQVLKKTFKKLTKQEFYVFSLLYQLEDEFKRPVTYTDLASRTNLTPNSLRDYISKLIAKKVPIIKEKLNNRQILLKIAPELRNIETLENLMRIVEG